jgi:hypothetical protein
MLVAGAVLSFASRSFAITPLVGEPSTADLVELSLPRWSQLITLRASGGYRDNILLSAFAPTGRGFARTEAEVFASSFSQGVWQWTTFLNGDILRYFSPIPETSGEQQWFAHGELRWNPSARIHTTFAVQGYYQDMVLDLSETETIRVVAPIRVRGGMVTGSARIALIGGFALEPSFRVHRSDYLDYTGDYRETQEGVKLEWKRDDHLVVSAGWRELQRPYSERTEYTAGGRALPDTHLRFAQNEVEFRAKSSWLYRGKWTASMATARLQNRDQASGYFDYDQDRGKAELAWSNAGWGTTFGGEIHRDEYLVQTVGVGTAPSARVSRETSFSFRLERSFASTWTLFAEARQEHVRSNEEEFTYLARSILAGLERSF